MLERKAPVQKRRKFRFERARNIPLLRRVAELATTGAISVGIKPILLTRNHWHKEAQKSRTIDDFKHFSSNSHLGFLVPFCGERFKFCGARRRGARRCRRVVRLRSRTGWRGLLLQVLPRRYRVRSVRGCSEVVLRVPLLRAIVQ